MLSKAALLLLLGTTVSGQTPVLNDVEISNIDRVEPPSFTTTNVSISFTMNCNATTCFVPATSTTTGTFDRARLRTALIAAATKVASDVNTAAGNAATNAWVPTTASFSYDRVVESTNPVNPPMVTLPDGTQVLDSNYWNVFVRFTFADMPTDVSPSAALIVSELFTSYPGINFNSIWISTDAPFITDRLEPVKGRGHKDQKLLIPLILGIFSMLTVPMLVTWVLVQLAKKSNKAEEQIAYKSKVISEQQNILAGKNAAISTFQASEERRADEAAQEMEMRRLRNTKELDDEDVDWDAQKVENQPFGN